MSDPFRTREFEDYARGVMVDMVPKLKSSLFSLSIVPDGVGDVKFWVELGASIMLDKPIVILIEPRQQVTEKLRAVADVIIEADPATNEGKAVIRAALSEAMQRFNDPKGESSG